MEDNNIYTDFTNEDLGHMDLEEVAEQPTATQEVQESTEEESTPHQDSELLAEIKALREDNAKQLAQFNAYLNPKQIDEEALQRQKQLEDMGLSEVNKINDLEAMQNKSLEEIENLKVSLQRQQTWSMLEQEVGKRYPDLDFKSLKETANILRGVETGDPKAFLKLASMMSKESPNPALKVTKSTNEVPASKDEGTLTNEDYALRVLNSLDELGV